ncbi:hypothetical protein [Variovorax sp. KK3]|uniref:hypothetical protein n=1 Tax=Variovorax sp. KK3 TaxID=1855728 RepID=UPI00117CC5A7|nr:hypothetical protein [Variovorax sp. KK3]
MNPKNIAPRAFGLWPNRPGESPPETVEGDRSDLIAPSQLELKDRSFQDSSDDDAFDGTRGYLFYWYLPSDMGLVLPQNDQGDWLAERGEMRYPDPMEEPAHAYLSVQLSGLDDPRAKLGDEEPLRKRLRIDPPPYENETGHCPETERPPRPEVYTRTKVKIPLTGKIVFGTTTRHVPMPPRADRLNVQEPPRPLDRALPQGTDAGRDPGNVMRDLLVHALHECVLHPTQCAMKDVADSLIQRHTSTEMFDYARGLNEGTANAMLRLATRVAPHSEKAGQFLILLYLYSGLRPTLEHMTTVEGLRPKTWFRELDFWRHRCTDKWNKGRHDTSSDTAQRMNAIYAGYGCSLSPLVLAADRVLGLHTTRHDLR